MAILGLVLAAPVGVMYLAVPPNEKPEDGPADPIPGLRRPVLVALRAMGIVDRPARCFSGSESWKEGPDGERLRLCKMEIEREPVYRGIFWRVGSRITYRKTYSDDLRCEWQALRLCYTEGGKKFVAGEGTVKNGMLAQGGQCNSVHGYVPRSARGYWVEGVDEQGKVHCQDGWGYFEKFWRDEPDR